MNHNCDPLVNGQITERSKNAFLCFSISLTFSVIFFSSLLLALPGSIFYQCLVCMLGLVMYAYYHNCDPLVNGQITKRDQVSHMNLVKNTPAFCICINKGAHQLRGSRIADQLPFFSHHRIR